MPVTSPVGTLREGLPYDDRLGLLTIPLKGFFAPLMVLSLFDFTGTMIANGSYVIAHATALRTDFLANFNAHGFWFLFQLILFLDVLFFTVGYLVEHPALGNEIRSVDPRRGWAGRWRYRLSAVEQLPTGDARAGAPPISHVSRTRSCTSPCLRCC